MTKWQQIENELVHEALAALAIDISRWAPWRYDPWRCMDAEERARVREYLARTPAYKLAVEMAAYEDECRRKALAEAFPLLDAGISTRLALKGITPATIAAVPDDDLRAITGIGAKTLRLIRALYGTETPDSFDDIIVPNL